MAVPAAPIVAADGLTVNAPFVEMTALTVSDVLPAFVTTTLSFFDVPVGTLPNATDFVLGEIAVPVPVTDSVSWSEGALCVKTIFALIVEDDAGVNVMVNVLFAPGCTVPLVGLSVKRPLVEVTPVMTSGALPVFVTETLSGLLRAITTNPYAIEVLLSRNPASAPVPFATTVSGDVGPLCVNTM